MNRQARVVVIGGGIARYAARHRLTRNGWSDGVPVKRSLAAGWVVGWVTSAGWGNCVAPNRALGFFGPGVAGFGKYAQVALPGPPVATRVVAPCRDDPDHARVRA